MVKNIEFSPIIECCFNFLFHSHSLQIKKKQLKVRLNIPNTRVTDWDVLTSNLPNPRPMAGRGLVDPGIACDCCAEKNLS